jgi:DNA-binding protein H-NS
MSSSPAAAVLQAAAAARQERIAKIVEVKRPENIRQGMEMTALVPAAPQVLRQAEPASATATGSGRSASGSEVFKFCIESERSALWSVLLPVDGERWIFARFQRNGTKRDKRSVSVSMVRLTSASAGAGRMPKWSGKSISSGTLVGTRAGRFLLIGGGT